MKACICCGQTKPTEAFYRHRMMADGYLNKCIVCVKQYERNRYRNNREAMDAYERSRERQPARRAKKAEYQRRHRERHPDRNRARAKVNRAVRLGLIIKPPCVFCGASKVQSHHHDYSKPLDVTWACFKCHRERCHGQQVTAA